MSGGDISLKWNPKNLEIKTRSVEKTLEPLVIQVTTLVSSKSNLKKKGKSKRAKVLVAAVEKATENFVEKGELIAAENPGISKAGLQNYYHKIRFQSGSLFFLSHLIIDW